MDTDRNHAVIKESDPAKRAELLADGGSSWQEKRQRMTDVCMHCHTQDDVSSFYKQYDDLVILFNEKFAKPGQAIVAALRAQGLLTPQEFDEEIEYAWSARKG